MKSGYLSAPELARLLRSHQDVERLLASLSSPSTGAEETLKASLVAIRNELGVVIRWQQSARKPSR